MFFEDPSPMLSLKWFPLTCHWQMSHTHMRNQPNQKNTSKQIFSPAEIQYG